MPYDGEKVRRLVREGTNPKHKPTLQQVQAVSSLTYDSDAVEVVKRMLHRRLDPKAYVVPEVEHTMLMLRGCLHTASQDFVAYVNHELAPLITQFSQKGDRAELRGIHQAADSLLRTMHGVPDANTWHSTYVTVEGARKPDKQGTQDVTHDLLTANMPVTPPKTPIPSRSRTTEVLTSGNSTQMHETDSRQSMAGYAGLLIPEGYPAEENNRLEPEINHLSPFASRLLDDHISLVEDKVRSMTSNTPQAITMVQLEAGAEMTFDPTELEVIQNVIDTRLDALKPQQTYHHLIKTLTLVHHCLFHASDEFIEYFRRRAHILESLKSLRCPNYDVQGLADAVLTRLKDDRRLQSERQSRKALRRPRPISSDLRRLSSSTVTPTSSPKPSSKRQSLLERAIAPPIVEKLGEYAVGRGGHSDVWKGRLTLDNGAKIVLVAIKVLRLTSRAADPDRLRKRLEREVRVWRELDHPSIADFYGVIDDSDTSPAIISPWYERGSADVYLNNFPNANAMKLLWEIVLGVEYLHKNNVVHGDIKGGNVMVDVNGHAKLIDFGLSRLIDSVAGHGLTTSSVSFSIRWCAPELVQSDDSPTTKASDVYAFASTALELFTGDVPYHSLKERAVILAVTQGVPPKRPTKCLQRNQSCPDQFWGLLESCWKVASLRPSIFQVKVEMQPFYCNR